MPLSLCAITGTIYTVGGVAASGVKVWVRRVIKSGTVIESVSRHLATSDASGAVSFSLPRASTAYVYATAEGLNETDGVPLSIPDASTATLESLISVSLIPSTGLTVKDDGSSLANLIGTLDFRDYFTVTESPAGEANITLDVVTLYEDLGLGGGQFDFSKASNSGLWMMFL